MQSAHHLASASHVPLEVAADTTPWRIFVSETSTGIKMSERLQMKKLIQENPKGKVV